MRQHSKGPWTKEFGAFTPGYASTMRLVSADNTHAVADVFWGNGHSSANADLIAAAPEMLEALEAALRCLAVAENCGAFNNCAAPRVGKAAIAMCENAIAKAKGVSK